MLIMKHKIIVSIIAILSIAIVVYMYSQNYIQFEGGLRIVLPAKVPVSIEKSIVNETPSPANIQSIHIDTNLIGKVQPFTPSKESTRIVEKPRLFDDIIKAVQTFSPLMVPFITFYLYKKKKKIDDQKV